MTLFQCNYTCRCATVAAFFSTIVGIIAAFLQITGAITITPIFLLVALGIAVGYLGLLLVATLLARRTPGTCSCTTIGLVLLGILGTIAAAVLLLAVGITATGIFTAILVGLTALFFTLLLTATACLIRELTNCTAE